MIVMLLSCVRGPDKRDAAQRCSGRCSGRGMGRGGNAFALWRSSQRPTKGILSKDNIMTHVRPRGEHSTPKVSYGVPETCWERGGTSQRPWWRVRTMAGGGHGTADVTIARTGATVDARAPRARRTRTGEGTTARIAAGGSRGYVPHARRARGRRGATQAVGRWHQSYAGLPA